MNLHFVVYSMKCAGLSKWPGTYQFAAGQESIDIKCTAGTIIRTVGGPYDIKLGDVVSMQAPAFDGAIGDGELIFSVNFRTVDSGEQTSYNLGDIQIRAKRQGDNPNVWWESAFSNFATMIAPDTFSLRGENAQIEVVLIATVDGNYVRISPSPLPPHPQFSSNRSANGDVEIAKHAELREHVSREIERLRLISASSTNPCLVAQYIAFSSKEIEELFLKKVLQGNRFKVCTCLPSAPANQQYVLFNFESQEGMICLVKPSFLVVVDMARREAIKTIDPYLPDQPTYNAPAGSLPFALTVPSNAPNVSVAADALAPFQQREQAFGAALGLNSARSTCSIGTAYPTYTPTPVTASTYSPFPVQDDSQTLYSQDQSGFESTIDTTVDD